MSDSNIAIDGTSFPQRIQDVVDYQPSYVSDVYWPESSTPDIAICGTSFPQRIQDVVDYNPGYVSDVYSPTSVVIQPPRQIFD